MYEESERKLMKPIHAQRLQQYSLIICTALGAGAGAAFATSTPGAFGVMFGLFLWSLIAGTVVAIVASLSGRIKLDDWRRGLRLSAAIYFANSTVYILALLLGAAMGPAQVVSGQLFDPLTMARIIAPGVYFATSIMTLASIFFYMRTPGTSRETTRR